ncbi:MAG: LysR family transcriptional regulator [Zavarzinella sp.]|nr:LysR family transcriptional regulator [Zavarzinella sp.]
MADTDLAGVQLPHLETFAAAAELGSFAKAAKALGLTQAAVSLRVQSAEKVLGKSLFDRRGGPAMLTEAGRKLYPYGQRILDLRREAVRAVTGLDPPVGGELVIAASSIPGEHLLPALLSAFGRKYPHIRVRAAVSDRAAVLGQVERGEVSLGLVGRKADSPHLDFQFLATDRVVLIAPPGHALAEKDLVTVSRLAAHPLILREAGSGLWHRFEKALDKAGRSLADLRVVRELGSNEAIKEAVQRGAGVAVLSLLAVQKEVDAGQLKALRVRGVNCDRDLFVVQDRRRVPPALARLFLSLIEAGPIPEPGP